MRNRLVLAAVIALLASSSARAQALSPDYVHGVDYRFERMRATRTVHDASDNGKITLVTLVYRPIKSDRHEVILFSHGSTGGEIRSPKEPWEGPPFSVIQFFTSRGYTLVAPMRRGRAESSGTYVEECAFYAGECTATQQTAMADPGLREALADTNAVIDQIILGKLVPANSKVLLTGVSRGGFLSLMLAAQRPQLVKGVVNFVGGWLSVSPKLGDKDNEERLATQVTRFGQAGKSPAPSLWIYASRDPFYTEETTRKFFAAYEEGGGHGEYIFVKDHALPNGHTVASSMPLWQPAVDAFLKKLDAN